VEPPPPARGHGGAGDVAALRGSPVPTVMELLPGWLAEGYNWQGLTPAFQAEPVAVFGHGGVEPRGPVSVTAVEGWVPEGYNWQGAAPLPSKPALLPLPCQSVPQGSVL
jgi:hypothetical protein